MKVVKCGVPPTHEIERGSDGLVVVRCRYAENSPMHMREVPHNCPMCGVILDKDKMGLEDEMGPDEEEIIVPLTIDKAGQLVTDASISMGYAYIDSGKPAVLLPGYCSPPVIFLYWQWPSRPDINDWPPPCDKKHSVWVDELNGNWRFDSPIHAPAHTRCVNWQCVPAKSARFRIQKE